ncbi:MAG TPA: SDR family NAD(P)-dependent oxidoreductase [Nitrososphaerales archaeon]|nr:SDR family NAD(P)-dependent oxidoreductase [Nitrososphaerales archaeon]
MSSYNSISGKIVLVTGAASGIGLSTANLLESYRAKVVRVDRTFSKTKSQMDISLKFGADLRIASEVQSLIREVEATLHDLHVIVNCAGIEMRGTVLDLSEESYDLVMDTNVKSTFLVCKYGIPLLLKTSQKGAVINLSSDLGLQPIAGVDAYSASKGAIIALTKAMSKNWAKTGLRINCVAPGPIDTPLLHRFQDSKTLEFVKEVMLPQGRLGTANEVAKVVAFLASDESSLINGAILTANGGLIG